MELYYDKPFLKISWDAEINCVFTEWKGFVYEADLRTGLNKALELLQTKQAHKFLNDTRKLRVISQEDQAWIVKDWMPRTIKAGLRVSVSVVPESQLALASFNSALQKAESVIETAARSGNGIETASFHSYEEALAWIRSR